MRWQAWVGRRCLPRRWPMLRCLSAVQAVVRMVACVLSECQQPAQAVRQQCRLGWLAVVCPHQVQAVEAMMVAMVMVMVVLAAVAA